MRNRWMISERSLALAVPFIRLRPSVNSLIVSEPSPSFNTSQMSSISVSRMPMASNRCTTFGTCNAPKNSFLESSPEPSASISRKTSARALSSAFFFTAASFACCNMSSLAMLIAFSTMIAVMRFQNTNTPTMMKNTKNKQRPHSFAIMGRAIESPQASNVITWNNVNMERNGSPNNSWAYSSSDIISLLPMSSVPATPKM
mmetsp:Transcript_128626/g.372209  ORF Transcript_128626/g.372209 Transcript_128626/m.372209 type:complete len:201 (-) Transcript_128626:818-1420(-)